MAKRKDQNSESDNDRLKTKEREAATRAILDAISKSREDEGPVLQVIVETAARLCSAPFSCFFVCNEERTHFTVAVHNGTRSRFVDLINADPLPIDPEISLAARVFLEKKAEQIEDYRDDPVYRQGQRHRVHAVDVEGVRTALNVPLVVNEEAIGTILLYRREVLPFTDDEIAMVETFATQAAIAIEKVRQYREVQTRLEREAATRDILSSISVNRADTAPVFETILENAARLCKAQHSLLLMRNEANTHLELVANNSAKSAFIDFIRENPHDLAGKGSLAVQALNDAKTLNIKDLMEFETTRKSEQLEVASQVEKMRSLIVVPLRSAAGILGVICLYKLEVAPFSDDEAALVETFAEQAVIAIENVRQFRALETLNNELEDRVETQVREIERMGRLKRFLPAAVADTVVSSGSEKMLSSHRSLLGVLFCDIRGFTAFCETAEPEETIEVLQSYHEEMGKLINSHGAGVDHRMGDGIMVLFNDPVPCEDPAGEAVRLALAMRISMEELCKKWKRLGHRLGFGVGISLGYATVGMVGYEGRYDYTASGTAVNLAARLCDLAEDGEILLSPRAATAIEDSFQSTAAGEMNIKGISAPVEVFRLTDSR